jgi:hypothetical protein
MTRSLASSAGGVKVRDGIRLAVARGAAVSRAGEVLMGTGLTGKARGKARACPAPKPRAAPARAKRKERELTVDQ